MERSVTCVFTLCASQRTLGGAMEQVLRFSPAFTNFFTWQRHDAGDRVVLVPAAPPATRPGHTHTLDWHAVDLLNTGWQLAPFDGELHLASPLDAATVRFLSDALHGEVRAGQPRTQVSMPRAHLDAAITHHVPDAVARVARWAAEGALADRQADETMSRRVLQAIDARLGTGDTGVESVARSLALSRRTLARRLAGEDTRYETLLDEARRSRAAALLHQQRLSDAEIAAALGLSERSYFRNVRRWFGATPAALRSS
jgi:AraC-like DNA-binding protein